ncbi:hypothetical protein BHM03_00037719 [Ensete ventricosum]|nr:hypothetical protein BHM03_00037719 [Ensete ventricosum]
MLRAMNKTQKDHSTEQLVSDSPSDSCFSSSKGLMQTARNNNTSLFGVPGLFVGFSTKGFSNCDAVRSPTSPLDCKAFSSLGNSFLGSPRSASLDGKPRCWDCNRVGLSLVDALKDETEPRGKFLGLSESRTSASAPATRINHKSHLGGLRDDSLCAAPKSLPKDYAISSHTLGRGSVKPQLDRSRMSALRSTVAELEFGELGLPRSYSADISRPSSLKTDFVYQNSKSISDVFPSDSNSSMVDSFRPVEGSTSFDKFSGETIIGSSYGVITSLSASEIEQSEDYTCIISHGPNPKTTHIFGDCILESRSFPSLVFESKCGRDDCRAAWLSKPSEDSPPCSSDDFLRYCLSCNKKLEEGKDIYMYKLFCLFCRGEKAFCSCDCRDQEILIEEEIEKLTTDSFGTPGPSFHEDMFADVKIMTA